MADPNNPLGAPVDPNYATPGDPFPTSEGGAMVPGINRIPGERAYDPADELAPKYDKAVSQPAPYERAPYMSTTPDLTNPNDLAHPDNPTPTTGEGAAAPGTATTYTTP